MMSEESKLTALGLLKQRLNRADDALEEYWRARIDAAAGQLEDIGITLTDSVADVMLVTDYAVLLLVDYTVWSFQNRDKPGNMPEWLRLARRERWLNNRTVIADDT